MIAPKIRMGTTTYSFNDEFHSYQLSLEGLFRTVSELGPDQGIELIAPQCIRSYPQVSEEFEYRFKEAVDRHGFVPSAFGHYSDMGQIHGRPLTDDEMLDFSLIQLEGCKRLGFPIMRMSYQDYQIEDRSKALYRLLLPTAERLNIKLAMEIHAPWMIEGNEQRGVIEDVIKLGSPHVGFTLDCGTMTSRISPVCVRKFKDLGLTDETIAWVNELWLTRPTRAQIDEAVRAKSDDPLVRLMAIETLVYFGHGNPSAIRDVMPHLFHVHGKFFQVDEDGNDDAVRYPEIVQELVKAGYDGWISSEYEGHHWLKNRGAFDQVQAHQRYLMRLISESEARIGKPN